MNLELYPRDIHNLYEYDLTQEEKDYFETEDTGLTACEKCAVRISRDLVSRLHHSTHWWGDILT